MKIHHYSSQEELANKLSSNICNDLSNIVDKQSSASLALSGGNTPIALYQHLAVRDCQWNKVHITLTDERLVSVEHPRSNTLLMKKNLFSDKVPFSSFHSLYSGNDLDVVNPSFEQYFLPLNICVLGMGNDGHTASLFPGDKKLINPHFDSLIDFAVPPDDDLEPRITLTAKTLLMSEQLHLVIHGKDKLDVFEQAQNGEDFYSMPIRLILKLASDYLQVHYAE